MDPEIIAEYQKKFPELFSFIEGVLERFPELDRLIKSQGAVKSELAAQTKQVMVNVMACLAAAGTQATDLVSLEIKVVAGVDLRAAAQSAADYLDPNSLPLVSVSVVQQLARPGALVEVSAVAARLDAGDAVWLGRGEVADPAWF